MEFNKKKLGIIGTALIVAVSFGGFVYRTHIANAEWEANRQAVMASIDKQQAQEEAAYQAKANDPVVSEDHPARYAAPTDPTPAPTTDLTKSTNTSSAQNSSTPASSTPKEQSTATPQPIPTQTAPTTTTPPAQPTKIINDPVSAITSLSDSDIQRLQSYPTYGSTGQGLFENFTDYYTNYRDDAEGFFKKFTPTTLSVYNKAKVGWLSTPRLMYSSMIGQVCFRGILTLTYYGDNSFGLSPNVTYQREVEYRVMSSVETGFALSSIHYLSDFRAVK